MRITMILAVAWLAGCASEQLAPRAPAGVDLSGQWQLNEADSDDPQRLLQSRLAGGPAGGPNSKGSGRGASRRGGRGEGGPGGGGLSAAAMPGVGALGLGLRWPGKEVEIKQTAGVVAFTSDGLQRLCPHATGEASQPLCGWRAQTLIVRSEDADEDRPPFEERYSLSADGQRLIEVIGFTGGAAGGFTMSRVWDRVPQ